MPRIATIMQQVEDWSRSIALPTRGNTNPRRFSRKLAISYELSRQAPLNRGTRVFNILSKQKSRNGLPGRGQKTSKSDSARRDHFAPIFLSCRSAFLTVASSLPENGTNGVVSTFLMSPISESAALTPLRKPLCP